MTFIDNGVDTTTGMFKLKGTFANKDRRLWPGEFVDVALELSTQKNAVVVPTKAIQTGQQGEYVYVVRADSTAESRPVKTPGTYQNMTVVAEGLNAGEQVIVNGQLRVAPNAKVVVQSTLPATQTDRPRPESCRRRTVSISALFIKRPIMTTLVMAAILDLWYLRLSACCRSATCRTWIFPRFW